MLKSAKGAGNSTKKSNRSKASVRSTKGGTRKRNVVVESEESDGDIEEEEEEEEEGGETEQEHEQDFISKVIQEEFKEIYL